jgi:RNA polymerase sigma factor (sigma-70 family)
VGETLNDAIRGAWKAGEGPFWAWVRSIARRRYADHVRDMHRQSRVVERGIEEASESPRESANDPSESLAREESRSQLHDAMIRMLSEDERALLLLRLRGVAYDVIAQHTGQDVAALRKRYERMMLRLAATIASQRGKSGQSGG